MALADGLVGTKSAPVEFSWGPRDVMLYALAVGAGQADPADELALTTENSEGVEGPQPLPSFAAIITRGARVYPPPNEEDPRVLHAEQAFRIHAPLPASGTARVTATVVGTEDKRSGMLIRTLAEAVDAETGAPLAETLQTIMVRGESGGAGPDDDAPAPVTAPGPIPDREPDRRVTLPIRADQALLYRLTGDRNPLHSDPAFARRGGFDRPILHGMCTYGFTARVLGDGDPGRVRAMHARFTRPVLPGETLEVAVWRGDGGLHFRTTREGEPVLDQGWAELT